MSTRPLTTTSYAILGVLAIRPWSAYDLTAYMRTSAVRRLWPRTESRLYAEPKNLVAHGLVEAAKEYTGRRGRTVYSITPAGRKALAEWLGERPGQLETEDEYVLKITLADHGTRDQLLANIRWAMEEMLEMIEAVRGVSERVLEGDPRFPERLHLTALNSRHGVLRARARYEFLKWAEDWVSTWKDTGPGDKEDESMRRIRESRAELERIRADLQRSLQRDRIDS